MARQPRVDGARLLRWTFAVDVLRRSACDGRLDSWELVEDGRILPGDPDS